VSVPDSEERPGARSRGDLTARFLLQEGPGAESPMQFLGGIDPSDYNSLNVFLGDLASGDLAYFTNRDGRAGASRVETVGRGVHTVSNDVLGEGWPKTRRLAAAMEALAARHGRRREVGVDVDALHEDVLAVMREDGGAAGPGAGRSRSGEAWGGEGGGTCSLGTGELGWGQTETGIGVGFKGRRKGDAGESGGGRVQGTYLSGELVN